MTSQHPGFSNIVGDYCLFIFIAFSCYGIFRPCHKLISLPGHIASSYSNSHKLTTKVSHTSPFFFWWNIFPPHCADDVYFGLSACSELLPSLHTVQLSFTSCFKLCSNPKSWKSHQTSLKNCFLQCEQLINTSYATMCNVICTYPSSLHLLNNPTISGTGKDAWLLQPKAACHKCQISSRACIVLSFYNLQKLCPTIPSVFWNAFSPFTPSAYLINSF